MERKARMDSHGRILIVDDDAGTRRSLALVFGQKGYEVDTAETGREALEKTRQQFFNTALVDIQMPDVHGIELLAPMKKMHPDMELIMVTGHASMDTAVQALNEGASAYITKPLDLDAVLARVRDVLERQRLIVENRRLYRDAQRELAERIKAEEEKDRIHAQLLQSQKMEAVGRLAGGIAHDFNNVLTAIMGYSQLLLESLNTADSRREEVDQIQRAGERAASLIRQLLAFSRKQVLQPKVLDLNLLVADMEKMLRRLIGENIDLSTVLEPELAHIKADVGQIEQVVMNLVVNARDAVPKGGKITVRTENVTLDDAYRERSPQARPGTFACLSVTDTGHGIDQEIIPHIFEPFFTTKEQGTGLGLSVIYGIVEQHEGWIEVYSEMGQGSTFRVYLPISLSPAQREGHDAVVLNGLQGLGERILLVEDEEGIRTFVVQALSKEDYVVVAAATAQEALDLFERAGGDFDLVFSDVILPDRGGLHLVDQLLDRNPDLPVLLSSGYTDENSGWPIIQERGFPFLPKPYHLVDLLCAVKDALAGSDVADAGEPLASQDAQIDAG
jgi:two-component system, cell cycle sensor histidine kinase and response regulator CckA